MIQREICSTNLGYFVQMKLAALFFATASILPQISSPSFAAQFECQDQAKGCLYYLSLALLGKNQHYKEQLTCKEARHFLMSNIPQFASSLKTSFPFLLTVYPHCLWKISNGKVCHHAKFLEHIRICHLHVREREMFR